MSYLITFLLIGLVILFHEFGHFWAAKRSRIPIAIFSIGFGPRLIGKKWGDTEYRLSLIPFGGYVLPGVRDEEEFFSYSANKRIIMAMGGPLASFLLTVVSFSIISLVTTGLSLQSLFFKPLTETFILFYEMVSSLPSLFTGTSEITGILGILSTGAPFIGRSLLHSIHFIALMSLNFTVLNLLPVPVLDGGKVLLYLLEKIHPKFLGLHVPCVIIGWIFMLGLMLYVTVIDVIRIFV